MKGNTWGEIQTNPELAYQRSFGNMPDGTVYLDLLGSTPEQRKEQDFAGDLRPELNKSNPVIMQYKSMIEGVQSKASITTGSPLMAIGTTYSTTSGSIPVLYPSFVDPQLYDKTVKETPLASGLIPRVTNKGLYADIVKRTAVQTAAWKPEEAALTAAISTYTRTAQKIKAAYATGSISRLAMAAQESQQMLNSMQFEQEGAIRSLKYLEEDTIINGDVTNATYINGFNGFIASVTTNTNNKSSTELALNDLDVAIQTVFDKNGLVDLITTDYRTFNKMKALMRDILIHPSGSPMKFGFEEITYDGVPVVVDKYMPTTTNGREVHLWTVKKQNNVQMRVLQDATLIPLAQTSDTIQFYVALYETMVFVFEDWCYRIYNCV